MRRDARYQVAKDRVKIAHFTEQGLDIRGIIHVGANDGYEMQWYQMMGIEHLLGIEPLPSACDAFRRAYPDIPLLECALGDADGTLPLTVTAGDGQGSSLLREFAPNPEYVTGVSVPVDVRQFTTLVRGHAWLNPAHYDCLVLDVQGYELPALRGFGGLLWGFDLLNIECSRVPVYEGGVPAQEVIDFLARFGFAQDSPIEEHNDIMFRRQG